jgi:hypothetical protein
MEANGIVQDILYEQDSDFIICYIEGRVVTRKYCNDSNCGMCTDASISRSRYFRSNLSIDELNDLDPEVLPRLVNAIIEERNKPNKEAYERFKAEYEKEHANDDLNQVDNKKAKEKCPECRSELVRKNGRYGPFWGCKSFPKCRYTKKIQEWSPG